MRPWVPSLSTVTEHRHGTRPRQGLLVERPWNGSSKHRQARVVRTSRYRAVLGRRVGDGIRTNCPSSGARVRFQDEPCGQRLSERSVREAAWRGVSSLLLRRTARSRNARVVVGRRTDVLAWNQLGAALFADFGRIPEDRRTYVRLLFGDPTLRDLHADWEEVVHLAIAQLRMLRRRPERHGLRHHHLISHHGKIGGCRSGCWVHWRFARTMAARPTCRARGCGDC
ncbi:hypothetical protein [Streptomyces sp. NPDC001480]|uniref:MmyB family transcriptional regulator n=1 Tax=Streptomyces sp. NPDC001480 TaxID=3364577 RepID=UPI003689E91C